MRKATKIIAMSFGLFAAFGGLEHGYFEVLQGNARPAGLLIASMGPPCDPAQAWHMCEPAMTIIPSFLITGILSILLGLVTAAWSLFYLGRRRGGPVLALLSLGLLLFGGGLFPPIIGIVGGIVGSRINAPLPGRAAAYWRSLAFLWPWPLALFFTWLFGQLLVGHLFKDWMKASGFLVPGLILGLMAVAVLAALGHDRQHG
jgi:hypothetical protein